MKRLGTIFLVLLSWVGIGTASYTMKLERSCGCKASDLRIENWSPPPHFFPVNSDFTVTVPDTPRIVKLRVDSKIFPDPCPPPIMIA